jgi:hypothetical protein
MLLWLPRNTRGAERETTERRKASTGLLKREERNGHKSPQQHMASIMQFSFVH